MPHPRARRLELTMKTTFNTKVKATGNNTGIEVPADKLAELGSKKTPAVKVDLSGYSYKSTVAVVSGVFMIPLSAAHRKASGLGAGDSVEVVLELDQEPRTVEVPEDLRAALSEAGVKEAFDALSFSRRKEFVRQVEEAKAQATRERRIAKIVAGLSGD